MWDYFKYHGLGNDYLVLEPARFRAPPTPEAVRRICDRHRGVGGDGILLGPLPGAAGDPPAVRIFNPDGSEAEKSGNGLRIFARHLWARGHVTGRRFAIGTAVGPVEAELLDEAGRRFALAMGEVRFTSADIPWSGPPREALGERVEVGGVTLELFGATVGNPHCVVFTPDPTPEAARTLGPLLETHPLFPHRTNVQLARVEGPHDLRIEIWERGAGYTLASGSSSCAAAAVACRLGKCTSPVTVHMPGGTLVVELDAGFHARLVGEVEAVGQGDLAEEFLAALGLERA